MKDRESKPGFSLRVADNFHYGDASETYTLGDFDSLEAAVAAAKNIVDECLRSTYRADMTSQKLYESYTSFGEDPYILGGDTGDVLFSAWEYAKVRCVEICSGKGDASESKS
jgi:hypothetical protein